MAKPALRLVQGKGTGGSATKVRTPSGGNGPPSDGGGQAVDIAQLQTHVRWMERGMIAMAVCLLALAGFAWHGYDNLNTQATNIAVKQEALSGRIDTLDAKLTGKLEAIGDKLNDQPQRSPRAR